MSKFVIKYYDGINAIYVTSWCDSMQEIINLIDSLFLNNDEVIFIKEVEVTRDISIKDLRKEIELERNERYG